MDAQAFVRWRKEAMGLKSRAAAAELLGLSPETVKNYETGCRPDGRLSPIPHTVALACAALYHRLEPWS